MFFIFLFFVDISAQDENRGCDANCTLPDSAGYIRCGKVVSTHPEYGDKCVYLSKGRSVRTRESGLRGNVILTVKYSFIQR